MPEGNGSGAGGVEAMSGYAGSRWRMANGRRLLTILIWLVWAGLPHLAGDSVAMAGPRLGIRPLCNRSSSHGPRPVRPLRLASKSRRIPGHLRDEGRTVSSGRPEPA